MVPMIHASTFYTYIQQEEWSPTQRICARGAGGRTSLQPTAYHQHANTGTKQIEYNLCTTKLYHVVAGAYHFFFFERAFEVFELLLRV